MVLVVLSQIMVADRKKIRDGFFRIFHVSMLCAPYCHHPGTWKWENLCSAQKTNLCWSPENKLTVCIYGKFNSSRCETHWPSGISTVRATTSFVQGVTLLVCDSNLGSCTWQKHINTTLLNYKNLNIQLIIIYLRKIKTLFFFNLTRPHFIHWVLTVNQTSFCLKAVSISSFTENSEKKWHGTQE